MTREIYEHELIVGIVPTGEQLNADVAVGLPRDSASLVKTTTNTNVDTVTRYDRLGHAITGIPMEVDSVDGAQQLLIDPRQVEQTGKKLITYIVVGGIVLIIARALFR